MFDFEVIYVLGTENILSDALSRIYSNDAAGTVRTASEYSQYDETVDTMEAALHMVAAPVFVGMEAECASSDVNYVGRRSKQAHELPGAETGHAETSEEFAARMKDRFTLKGPKEAPPKEKLVI